MATDTTDTDWRGRPQVMTALAIGAILTILGVVGFALVPDEGQLFGLFGVNTLHNVVHLVTGIAGLAAGYAATGAFSDEYNKVGGLAYLGIAVLWLVVPGLLNRLLNIGLADTLLHVALGVVLAGVGFGMVDRLG